MLHRVGHPCQEVVVNLVIAAGNRVTEMGKIQGAIALPGCHGKSLPEVMIILTHLLAWGEHNSLDVSSLAKAQPEVKNIVRDVLQRDPAISITLSELLGARQVDRRQACQRIDTLNQNTPDVGSLRHHGVLYVHLPEFVSEIERGLCWRVRLWLCGSLLCWGSMAVGYGGLCGN